MDVLGFIALVMTGFTACAEFGSYAFVHPVIRVLPPEQHVQMEQGLLKTFGRIMPVFMTLCVVVALAYAIQMNGVAGLARGVRWAAAVAFIVALISTMRSAGGVLPRWCFLQGSAPPMYRRFEILDTRMPFVRSTQPLPPSLARMTRRIVRVGVG